MRDKERCFNFKDEHRNFFVSNFFGSKEFLVFYILHILNEKDYYGEEIGKKISELLEGLWTPNPGFIYPLLKKMSMFGLIDGSWTLEASHPRLIYKITENGRLFYSSLYEKWKSKLNDFVKILEKVDKEV